VSPGFTDISWAGLLWSLLLVLVAVVLSRWQQLGLESRIIIGCLRTVGQLLALGYALSWIIGAGNPWLVLAAATLQVSFACWTTGSLMQPALRGSRLIALYSLLPAYLLILGVLVVVVIQPEPYWDPRIVLPLGGMLLGNAMTAVALALNRYRDDLTSHRPLILARMALGVDWRQAVQQIKRNAASAAILPTVAALYTVGLVAIPGMMSGQIIAGLSPVAAVKYQIVVMFMLAAVVGLSVAIALTLMIKRARFEDTTAKRPGRSLPA
jgi:putative ABC transport system permease protein